MEEKLKIGVLNVNPQDLMNKRIKEHCITSEFIIIAKDIISIKFPFFQEYYY